MDAQDEKLGTEVNFDHQVYAYDDYLGDIPNLMYYPVETLEGDWEKLGPIPSEIFREMPPPVNKVKGGDSGGEGSADSATESCVLNDTKSEPNFYEEAFKSEPCFFEAPSPDSVLEDSTSSSSNQPISFKTKIQIPVKTRTKRDRSRSTLLDNPWSKSTIRIPLKMPKKKKRKFAKHGMEIKKCRHCGITKTPQWRKGPDGPKTLCNACGVRFRSGRLCPEYRPAASPSFVPGLHSNSHRKVVEMIQKGGGMDDNF